ncbi:MAG TPA: hypothetical protein EYH54_02085 [Nautiliaceae bacterium]|nr:hypothetical protein [Nautiliaceae bacterium]
MTFLELEKKCKRRRIFKILGTIFLFTLVLGIYLFLDKNNFLLPKKQEQKLVKNVKEKMEKKIENKNNKKGKILELKFEVNFPELYQNYQARISSNLIKNHTLKQKQQKKVEQTIEKKEKIKEKKLEKKIIKSRNLPPYETCIKLAKKYYEKGDYKQALKWAKNANIQDNKKASSWIITAKILYKMGKKDEAIQILEIYYKYSYDEKIKDLIKSLIKKMN